MRPEPFSVYESAVAEARREQAGRERSTNSVCQPLLMTHGRKTAVAVVWLHGYTNCPRQYEALGRRCYDKGWNVWIPLAPHHGLSDRLTEDTRLLTAKELELWADRAVDIAHGLGQRVVVGGLSMGGAAAAWLGLRRQDVAVALSVAPAITPLKGPAAVSRLAGALFRTLPNVMAWWDPRRRETLPGPKHAYLRYSLKGLAEILRLGFSFADEARKQLPAAGAFRLMVNDGDEHLNNSYAERIIARWKRRGAANISLIRLGSALGLKHDFIDPDQPYQQIDIAYPLLIGAIEDALATLDAKPDTVG
jgi:pimeloyl-ACP methyl ester carboxylesterase